MELLLERVAPAVAVEHGSMSFVGEPFAAPAEAIPFLSGQQVGGATEGCANNHNHEHPPFRAVLSVMHALQAAYVSECACRVKAN
jgi:hypothetical protein